MIFKLHHMKLSSKLKLDIYRACRSVYYGLLKKRRKKRTFSEHWTYFISNDPVVIDTVCQFLTNQDLYRCMQVNSRWSVIAWKRMDCSSLGPHGVDQWAVRWACSNNVTSLLSRLLLRDDIQPSSGLRAAIFGGHADIVRMLLADHRVDPSADNNFAIRWACATGQFDIVKHLLEFPQVDPLACGQEALNTACAFGHDRIVQLLVRDWRVLEAGRPALVTAVHFAHAFRRVQVLRVLISDDKLLDVLMTQA